MLSPKGSSHFVPMKLNSQLSHCVFFQLTPSYSYASIYINWLTDNWATTLINPKYSQNNDLQNKVTNLLIIVKVGKATWQINTYINVYYAHGICYNLNDLKVRISGINSHFNEPKREEKKICVQLTMLMLFSHQVKSSSLQLHETAAPQLPCPTFLELCLKFMSIESMMSS